MHNTDDERTLGDFLQMRKGKPFEEDQILQWLAQIAWALRVKAFDLL